MKRRPVIQRAACRETFKKSVAADARDRPKAGRKIFEDSFVARRAGEVYLEEVGVK